MKVTEEMIAALRNHTPIGAMTRTEMTEGLTAVLALIEPDVQPFTFAGHPDSGVYIHPCGTMADVSDPDTLAHIEEGECDCESGQPWNRIYVKAQK